MSERILAIKDLNRAFDNGVVAVKHITMDVYKGEFLAIIGPSGAGKSTLLKCINRLIEPNSGSIIYKDADGEIEINHPESEHQEIRKKISMIFQQFNLISRYSVLTNVLVGRLGYTSTFKSLFGLFSEADRKIALKNIERVGLADKIKDRVDQLSGGQQQRVAIARSLTQEAQILLADEPVASLDITTSQVVMDYLKNLNKDLGLTVVCSLHSMDLVKQYATRVVALKNGEKVFEGLSSELTEDLIRQVYGNESELIEAKTT